MGLFDFVPTLPEVFDFVACRVTGHEWEKDEHGVTRCKDCGKPVEWNVQVKR